MRMLLSETFFPLLEQRARYLVLCGGRGSGKSEFAARKIFYRCMKEGGRRFLVLRKVRKTLQESCIKVIRTLLAENGIRYDYNKTDRIITFLSPNGLANEVVFDGLDDREKIKSWKAATSVWCEELTEFTRDDFMEIDLILREPTSDYKQIIATFNLLGRGRTHVLFTDGKANYQHLGNGSLDFDGHCTFSPDQQWLATDHRSSGAFGRSLILYDMQRGECTTLAEIDMKERRYISGDLRCDFHPRWNRAGDAICFDAIDPATANRQLHIAHLSF